LLLSQADQHEYNSQLTEPETERTAEVHRSSPSYYGYVERDALRRSRSITPRRYPELPHTNRLLNLSASILAIRAYRPTLDGKGKLTGLPRPWPLLKEGQDPHSLEARVAFHLHRLKLVGRALLRAGYHAADAADLAAARAKLSANEIQLIANRLGTQPLDLIRDLTPHETRQWEFYRVSASKPDTVWCAARTTWMARGLTDKQAAALMGYTPKGLSKAINTRRPLQFLQAARLSTALNIPEGPEVFLPSPIHNDHQPSR
jgi:hypothetical protein